MMTCSTRWPWGDFTFQRTFAASEVLFFELAAQDVRRVVDGLYESYAKLIAYTA